jgi:hypothetical protein
MCALKVGLYCSASQQQQQPSSRAAALRSSDTHERCVHTSISSSCLSTFSICTPRLCSVCRTRGEQHLSRLCQNRVQRAKRPQAPELTQHYTFTGLLLMSCQYTIGLNRGSHQTLDPSNRSICFCSEQHLPIGLATLVLPSSHIISCIKLSPLCAGRQQGKHDAACRFLSKIVLSPSFTDEPPLADEHYTPLCS